MAALTLGTLATAAAVGAAGGSVMAMKKKAAKIAGQKQPPSSPMDANPSIPAVDPIGAMRNPEDARKPHGSVSVADSIRHAANRRKAKTGRSGTLLTGPSGLADAKMPKRNTLIGL